MLHDVVEIKISCLSNYMLFGLKSAMKLYYRPNFLKFKAKLSLWYQSYSL